MDAVAPRTRNPALAVALALAGLVALYAGALTTGFLNDDYLFLEDARMHGLSSLLAPAGALANYFRPLSRQLWFGLLAVPGGGSPLWFHVALFAVFLAALALLYDLLRAFVPPAAAGAGVLWFAVLPLQRVNLVWISCSQDLLALAFTLAAVALYRRGRDPLAWLAYLCALLSKEAALPLPALLALWSWGVERRPLPEVVRRKLPFALPVLLWGAGEWHLRTVSRAAAVLHLDAPNFAAAFAHLPQALLGLDQLATLPAALGAAAPPLLAVALLAPLAAWVPERSQPDGPHAGRPFAVRWAMLWLVGFTLPIWPVAHYWSAYFYTTAAVGGALLVALAARRLGRWTLASALVVLLGWNAVVTASPSFATVDGPWTWTSHLTAYYFQRGAMLSARLRSALRRVEPAPQRGTRFFFATLPPWAGFQMGNGAAIRDLYRDESLEAWFYSQFGDTTAADQPCVFLFWNGVDFERLYGRARDTFFQVGADLLLLDRPAGAVHAFRRGLARGEPAVDNLYWLGWGLLWDGRRDAAERAWSAFGARDDSTRWATNLVDARSALAAGDSALARRRLFDAIGAGLGRPEAHALLGELLPSRSEKFALLETKVALFLRPDDWRAGRELFLGLARAHLDDAARSQYAHLLSLDPGWATDSTVARVARMLDARSLGGAPLVPDKGGPS